jgi:hypothetical protein
LVVDEVGYLTYGPDAANVLFHVVNDRHQRKRSMIFTTNKLLSEWGKVLHDDLAAAILDRILEQILRSGDSRRVGACLPWRKNVARCVVPEGRRQGRLRRRSVARAKDLYMITYKPTFDPADAKWHKLIWK